MILRDRHVEPVDASILRMVVRAPRVLCTLVNVGRAFLGDLPLGAASLGGLRAAISGVPFSTAFLLRIAATLLIARERNTLGQFANAFPNLLERRGESNDLGVLLVRSYPGAISDHVPVHLVEPFDDVGGWCDLLHDPLKFQLINEEHEFLCRGGAKCTKQVRDETLVGVRQRSGLGMDLLEIIILVVNWHRLFSC